MYRNSLVDLLNIVGLHLAVVSLHGLGLHFDYAELLAELLWWSVCLRFPRVRHNPVFWNIATATVPLAMFIVTLQ